MAQVGMRYPVWAKLEGQTEGQEPSYGTGIVLAESVSADISPRRADAVQYGDDREVERDNSVIGCDVTIEVTDLEQEKKAQILGMVKAATGKTYELTDDASPYGGLGYIDVTRRGTTMSYVAKWIYKVQLGQNSMASRTREGQTTFTGATLSGSAVGIKNDDSGKQKFFAEEAFATEAEAKSWLNTKAHITGAASA